MKIQCSIFNEVSIKFVESLVDDKNRGVVVRPCREMYRGAFLGILHLGNFNYHIYAGDEAIIRNVSFAFAKGEESYFNCECEIN